MPTQLSAFSCAFITLILFSCSNEKNETGHTSTRTSLEPAVIEARLMDEPLNVNEYSDGFIEQTVQHFTAFAKRVSVITAKGGLKITVDPSMLEGENGLPVSGKIKVNILELTRSIDFFKSNAATMSYGRLLSSGGSYFVAMECGGQKLRIKAGKTIRVEFPRLSGERMKLFYGERDAGNNMNWQETGQVLRPVEEESVQLFENNRGADAFPVIPSFFMNQYRPYKTLNEPVYYYNKVMTIREMVDTINRYTKKVYVDTAYSWPKELKDLPKGTRVDTNYLTQVYGPRHQFFVKTYKGENEEKERIRREQAMRDSMLRNWQPQSLSGQLQKYYAPSAISALGWLNCDIFYQPREWTDVEAEVPDSLSNSHIQCFFVFKSFNGLMNLGLTKGESQKKIFKKLPLGETVILIAFTKANGRLFQCRKEFVIQKNNPLSLEFKNISAEDMSRMFGKNIKT